MTKQYFDPYNNLKNYECYITILRDYGNGKKVVSARYVFLKLELALKQLKKDFMQRHFQVFNKETGEWEDNIITIEEIIPDKYYKVIEDTKNHPLEAYYYIVSMFDK